MSKRYALESLWFKRAMQELEPGEQLFLPVETKDEQRLLSKRFEELKRRAAVRDPVEANRIAVLPTFRDNRLWVALTKKNFTPTRAYVKHKTGDVSAVEIPFDPDRERKIALMLEDGYAQEQINETLSYPLTKEELEIYFP